MGFMMKLPQFQKKHLIVAGILGVIAVTSFILGTRKVEPKTERMPASVPAEKDSAPSTEDEHFQEEEIDIQVAASSVKPKEDQRGTFTKLVDTYANAISSVNDKVQTIKHADEENRKLKLENAYLRVMVESQNYNCRTEDAKKKTETVGKKMATTAGSKAARSLASIRYQFPENLLPEQLHALGVSYFKVKDDEKAAVIMNFLTEMDDDKSFKTASNYLMAGIAFYRLDNFKNAKAYFEKIGNLTETDAETMKAKRQASYWKALVADRMKDSRTAQRLIPESPEKNPNTNEARRVNPNGMKTNKIGRPGSVPTEGPLPASEVSPEKESHETEHKKTETHH